LTANPEVPGKPSSTRPDAVQNSREYYVETFPDIWLDRIADDKDRRHIVPVPDEAYRFRQSARDQAIPFDDRPA
jgi:hypothetical protein